MTAECWRTGDGAVNVTTFRNVPDDEKATGTATTPISASTSKLKTTTTPASK